MSFDEARTCFNCLFHLVESEVDVCRFNAPTPILQSSTVDIRHDNRSSFPPCFGPGCGQWQPETEPEIEIDETLPPLVEK